LGFKKNSNKLINTKGGYAVIRPWLRKNIDSLQAAEHNCETILHELKHVSDFQNNEVFKDYNKMHDDRPHEKRANFFARYIAKIPDELILNLAIEIENIQKNQKEKDRSKKIREYQRSVFEFCQMKEFTCEWDGDKEIEIHFNKEINGLTSLICFSWKDAFYRLNERL